MMPNIDAAERMKVIAARINGGVDTFAGRQDAWHGLGVVTGEFQTWQQLLKAAKADFGVVKKQLGFGGKMVAAWGTFRVDSELPKGLTEEAAIRVRNPAGDVRYLSFLGPVGEDYQIIQHTEGFDMLDHLVGQINGAHYETMGTLDFGRVVWGQVDPELSIKVGDDETKIYLSFVTSHDGSKAFDIYETGVRMVCRNTVRLGALKKLAARLRVKHTKNAQTRIDNLKTEVDEIRDVAMTMQERLNFLAKRKVTRDSLDSIMERLFPKPKNDKETSTRRENILSDVLSLYEYNDGGVFKEQKGTAYNLLNAITEYTDHVRSTKGDGRAVSAVFGSGDKLKTQALDLILAEAEKMPKVEERVLISSFADIGLNVKQN
jgi:phage/plasmid-like protein (TIGR03299 family)